MNSNQATLQNQSESTLPKINSATDADIIAYLRRSYKIAEIATLAERDALILDTCVKLNITISEQELQAAGDKFRSEYNLLGAKETMAWLSQQRISVENWSESIRVRLLEKKLKEQLFSEGLDTHYLNNRNSYKRAAISQILVSDLTTAMTIVRLLREENASFCALALEYSKGRQSKENGGFLGIRFLAELMPEMLHSVSEAKEGEVLEPIATKLGYHIIKVEKWLPVELDESLREQLLESAFQLWLQDPKYFNNLQNI